MFLQHIGKMDRPPEVVIFLHICKIAIVVFLSIYHYLTSHSYQNGGIKMKLIRRYAKLVNVILTIMMLSLTIPYQPVFAAMIGTETTLDSAQAQQARDDIKSLLLRKDVQNALMVQGVDPIEAELRIDSLSDAEVVRLADQIHKIPAGGSAGTVIVAVLVVAVFVFLFIVVRFAAEAAADALFD
jgi:hypothetical protein